MKADSESEEVQKAVAIEYGDKVGEVPRIAAGGIGSLAEEIIRIARENDIPVEESEDLCSDLLKIRHGRKVEQESVELAAELINFLTEMDKKYSSDYLSKI